MLSASICVWKIGELRTTRRLIARWALKPLPAESSWRGRLEMGHRKTMEHPPLTRPQALQAGKSYRMNCTEDEGIPLADDAVAPLPAGRTWRQRRAGRKELILPGSWRGDPYARAAPATVRRGRRVPSERGRGREHGALAHSPSTGPAAGTLRRHRPRVAAPWLRAHPPRSPARAGGRASHRIRESG